MNAHRRFPPSPHNPFERERIAAIGPWEVRVFSPGGVFHQYFAGHGMLHVQLWHPASGVSVLTPSRLTRGCFEVYPFAGWKYAREDYAMLQDEVWACLHVRLPDEECVREVRENLGSPDFKPSRAIRIPGLHS